MNILIVKLGALGDVLRTTPLLTALKRKYSQSHVTWIVDARHREVLEGNPHIDALRVYDAGAARVLSGETYDLAVNLDKDDEALELIEAARAAEKAGFARDKDGRPCAVDSRSDYALRLGIDDELKFRLNKKSYQEISFEQLGMKFSGEEYVFCVPEEEMAFASSFLRSLPLSGNGALVGLNTGSGPRFAGKRLPSVTTAALAVLLKQRFGARVLVLGGEAEKERNAEITALSRGSAVDAGSHSVKRFAAIVKHCDLIVSGDTTAMHIAIAMKTPVVAYFASTCAPEIELYGRGRKIVSTLDCAPCYKKICPINEKCMTELSAEELCAAAGEALATLSGERR